MSAPLLTVENLVHLLSRRDAAALRVVDRVNF